MANAPENDVGWFAVFDGHGGERVSEFCAKNMQNDFLWRYARLRKKEKADSEVLMKLLNDCFLSFDEDIKMLPPIQKTIKAAPGCMDAGGIESTYMQPATSIGSTATVMTLNRTGDDAILTVAHAGDSRCLLFTVENVPQTSADAPVVDNTRVSKNPGSFRNFMSKRFYGETREEEVSMLGGTFTGVITPLSPRECHKIRRVLKGKYGRSIGKNVIQERLYVSLDHQPTDRTEAMRVVRDGGQVINNRVNGVLAVSRALGDADQKSLRGLTATPDTFSVSLKTIFEPTTVSNVNNAHTSFKTLKQNRKAVKSDIDEELIVSTGKEIIAVIASDGLWMYSPSDQVQADVVELLARGFTLQQICQVLMEKVIIDEKGIDNTSIVIIKLSRTNIPNDFVRSGSIGSYGSFHSPELISTLRNGADRKSVDEESKGPE